MHATKCVVYVRICKVNMYSGHTMNPILIESSELLLFTFWTKYFYQSCTFICTWGMLETWNIPDSTWFTKLWVQRTPDNLTAPSPPSTTSTLLIQHALTHRNVKHYGAQDIIQCRGITDYPKTGALVWLPLWDTVTSYKHVLTCIRSYSNSVWRGVLQRTMQRRSCKSDGW